MQTINNLPGRGLSSETMRGGFHVDTIVHPNPGFIVMEKWRDVKGYKGYYQASNLGRIKSLKRHGVVKDRILIPLIDDLGYLRLHLYKGGRGDHFISKLVAQAFIPNPNNKPEVNHIDGIKNNNNINNLEWCTRSENMIHAHRSGLLNDRRGACNANSKLTKSQVIQIRQSNKIYKVLAKEFRVSSYTIERIKNRRSWKHI